MWVVCFVHARQMLQLAALRDDKLFHFYDNLTQLEQEPHGYRAAYEDDIGVSEEVYCRLTFYNCRIRSVWQATPADGIRGV